MLEQTGISSEVDLAVEDKVITISSSEYPRGHWDEAFRNMADLEDDLLLDQVGRNDPAPGIQSE